MRDEISGTYHEEKGLENMLLTGHYVGNRCKGKQRIICTMKIVMKYSVVYGGGVISLIQKCTKPLHCLLWLGMFKINPAYFFTSDLEY